jgi:DNA-binding NtrC family response regulator
LYLPRAVSVEVEGNTQQELEPGPKLTIMVVEDDPGVQRIIDQVLRRDGHLVRIFGSAESALEALSSFDPEIIVSDIMLGSGMNGLQLAEQIRQSWPNQPLLLMSGNPESLMSEQDVESYPLIKKPFSSHDFLRSIRAVIQP